MAIQQDEEQQWHWKQPDAETESAKSFSTATECMLDAVRFAVQRRRGEFEGSGEDLLQ